MDEPSPGAPTETTDPDSYIMDEVSKIEQWKNEGIDTSSMEGLLFEDLDAYEKEKIRVLSTHLEGKMNGDRGSAISEREELVPGRQTGQKSDVITNIATEGQIPYEKPPLAVRNVPTGNNRAISTGKGSRGASFRLNRSRSKWIVPIAITLVAILAGASIAAYLLIDGNGPEPQGPDAHFVFSNVDPISGDVIGMNASDERESIDHLWEIVPSSYRIVSGSLTSARLELYFIGHGRYSIIHEVEMGSKTDRSSRELNVDPLEIRISPEYLDDEYSYSVKGNVEIENINGFVDVPEGYRFRSLSADFRTGDTDPAKSVISEGSTGFKDGFMQTYSTLTRTVEQDLDIVGDITDEDGNKLPFVGNSQTIEVSHIDLYNRRPSRIDVTNDMSLEIQIKPGTTRDYRVVEDYSMFPDLTKDYKELRLEDITRDRYLAEEEFGTVLWGSTMLNWKVEGVERFLDLPCLNVSLWMDPNTRQEKHISEFSMNVFLSDSKSVSLFTNVKIATDGSAKRPYRGEITQSYRDLVRGTDPIVYGTAGSYHDNVSSIVELFPEYISEFHDNWTYSPNYGNMVSSIPSDFDAQDAISLFSGKQTFNNFLSGLDDPYSVYNNYSEMDRAKVWKFSISDEDNGYGWNETVIKDTPITTGFKSRIEPVRVDRKDIEGILTFSGAESLMKRYLYELDQRYSRGLYGVAQPGNSNRLDMADRIIEVIADHPYPNIGMVDQGTLERIPYAFIIRSSDNRFEVCLDLQTGQVCYLYSRDKV